MRISLLLLPVCLVSGLVLSAQTAATVKTVSTKAAAPVNYKEMGNPSAKVTFEAYTDYECPHCAVFFRDIMPQIMAQYVQTGKVKFVHRDFPLNQIHQWAQLAARYANAAGEVGQYELVVNQIFKTQDTWSRTGNIEAEVMKVLPPGAMQKVRELVKSDPSLDASIKRDVDMGMNVDHVNSTPTIVIVVKGKREVVASPALPFSLWKSYLDKKLAE